MDVHGVINSSKIIMRDITMPMVSDDHIRSILSYQLEDYIPINPEEYVVKFIKLGAIYEDNVEKVNLLLIGIPKHIVESHFNLLKNVNLKPVALDYQGNAINKLINLGDNINDIYNNRDTVTNVDMGFDNTSITISNNGVIKVSRIIEGGANEILLSLKDKFDYSDDELMKKIMNMDDITQAVSEEVEDYEIYQKTEETIRAIIDRIEMIFRYYRTREIGNEINLVLLHGGLSNINGIEKLFTESFNIPCVKLDSISKVKFNGNLSKYANAIGGLIRLDVKK
jgi:type IV pilus assembly protein PilM